MKICIIKLGADGDVLRTIPLAVALKKKYPNADISWITRGDIATLLESNSAITTTIQYPALLKTEFDALYNFDIEKEALELAMRIPATKKHGFYEDGGYPAVFNPGAEYYLNTVFDDELKKKNTKTYQEMMFMAADLAYTKERYEITLRESDVLYARQYEAREGLAGKKIIGIHMGASSRWPSKAWDQERIAEFIELAHSSGYTTILFGGPNEQERHGAFARMLANKGIKVHRNNPTNTKREFAALVSLCDMVVCSDSFALHVGLALGKPTAALFFCTSPAEVEGYGLLRKIVSPHLDEFFPQRSNEYNKELTCSISAQRVFEEVKKSISNTKK